MWQPVGFVAAGAPLLAVSSLRGADSVDDTAVKFLLRAELKKKKEEDEERHQELADEVLDDKLEAEFDALMAIGHLTSRQEARLSAVMRERLELIERRQRRAARKSKKRRTKKKLPRSGLTRRRPRQWRGGYAGPDVLHHGRYGPEGLFRGSDVAVLHQGHQYLCRGAEAHSHGLAAQQIMVIPQCLFDKVVDVLIVQIVQFHRCRFKLWRKTGDFTGAVLGQGCGLACCGCRTGVLVQTAQKSVEIPQLQFLDKVMDVPVGVHVGTDSAEDCGFSTGACTGQVVHAPFVCMSVQTVQDVVDISLVAQRQFIMVLFVVLVLMRIRLVGQGLRLSLRGPGARVFSAGHAVQIR